MVLPGYPHYITQRGNRRQDVFFTDRDYAHYLAGARSRIIGKSGAVDN